jgi:hypothetical protein
MLIGLPGYLAHQDLAAISAPITWNPNELLGFTNNTREAEGVPALKENAKLDASARAKAEDLVRNSYFAHTSPSGKTPWDFIKQAGYTYKAAGENLAMDFRSPEAAHQALLASPSHRANIINPLYTEMGIAIAQGTQEGRTTTFVVEHFGTPLVKSILPQSTAVRPLGTSTPPSEGTATRTLPRATQTFTAPSATVRVLGAKTPLTIATENIPLEGGIALAAMVLLFLVAVSGSMTVLRSGSLSFPLAVRAFVIMLLAITALKGGVAGTMHPQTTPQSAEIIVATTN